MSIQSLEKEILILFHGFDDDMHNDLAYFWKHKDEIPILRAEIQTLEEHVLELLKILPNLKKHSYQEYKAKCEHLIGYLNHPSPSIVWLEEVRESLNLMTQETDLAVKRAKQLILVRKQQILEPMYKIVKLVAEFYRKFELYNLQKIEDALKAKGFDRYFIDGYSQHLESIRTRIRDPERLRKEEESLRRTSYNFLQKIYSDSMKRLAALKGNGQVPMDQSEVQSVMENLLIEFKLTSKPSQHELVLDWNQFLIPRFQSLIEALPRETGLIDISQSDSASDSLHQYAGELLASIGVKYYPIRLYRDDFYSPGPTFIMRHDTGAHPFPYTEALENIFPNLYNGIIIRVLNLCYHIPAKTDKDTWGGAFYYASSHRQKPT